MSEKSQPRSDLRTILASIVFFAMLLGLGIPVWWYTTAVHRANLPDLESLGLPAGSRKISIVYKSAEEPHKLSAKLKNVQRIVQKRFSYDVILVHQTPSQEELRVLNAENSIESVDSHLHQIQSSAPGLVIMEVPKTFLEPREAIFGNFDHVYISPETSSEVLMEVFKIVMQPVGIAKHKVDKTSKLHHSPDYNVLITVATSQPQPKWNIASLVDDYLDRFSQKLNYFANLTILTQVIYVGNGNIDADYKADSKTYAVDEDQVASLINAIEPKLGTHLSEKPTLHWVYYLPNAEQSPMHMYSNSGRLVTNNAVRSPRWNGGGLQIINDDDREELAAALLIGQLRDALGISSYQNSDSLIGMLNNRGSGIADWELESIILQRTIYCLNQASSTLKSLYQLLSQIENIVVSEAVRDEIVTSIQMDMHSKEAMLNGNLRQAYQDAQVSLVCAEKAFFDPSLLALLYFPDDQK